MNYQNQNRYNYVIDDRPMLGSLDDSPPEPTSNDDLDYDSKYDDEVNKFLDEANEELSREKSTIVTEKIKLPEDNYNAGPNYWYQDMRKKKIKETKNRLEGLSTLACYTCDTIAAHIKRIEQDHGTTFCKMDYSVRHPPLNKPWTNTWKFNCTIKCRETDKSDHTHTAYCESVILEHVDQNISQNDYPKYVEDAVKLFEDFAIQTFRNVSYSDTKEAPDTAYQKNMWTGIKLVVRSNCHNELMIIVRGKKITSLIPKLKRYFKSGPERNTNVISVFCLDQTWSRQKNKFEPVHITGLYKLKDNLGPISIEYKPKTNVDFNAVEATQLGKVIHEYAGLTKETTFLDVGCSFGVLSLMMSLECESVIGINTMHSFNNEIIQAEELKKINKIDNASFIACSPEDLLTKCSPFIKQCMTVAVLNLSSPYGKSKHVMQALRNLPSIWRVIAYGSFAKEFHRNINSLITEDHSLGEPYLPMQGCILDKSPTAENAFDVIIMFERESLITPKIELLAPGPTLNIKLDSEIYEYGSLNAQEIKPKLEMDRHHKHKRSKEKYEEKSPSPSTATRKDYSRYKEKISPDRRKKDRHSRQSISEELQTKEWKPLRIPKEERPSSSHRNQSPSTSAKEKLFDCSVPKESTSKKLQTKEWKPLRIPKEERPSSRNRNRSPTTSVKDKLFDCSVPKNEHFESLVLKNHEKLPHRSHQSRDKQSSTPHISLSVKKEFQSKCPPPSSETFLSTQSPPPPASPPPEETSLLEKDYAGSPFVKIVKTEPVQLYENKKGGVLNPADDRIPKVPMETEATDPSYFAGFSDANCGNISPPVTFKSEPADSSQLMSVKCEPEDMEISPNSQDIMYMETPIHNPRAFSDTTHFPPLAISTNVPVDDFALPVQTNLSYLPILDNNLLDTSQIKKEKDTGDSFLATTQTDDNEIPRVTIKSEPTDSCFLEINSENESLSTLGDRPLATVRTEDNEIPRVTIKSEPTDSSSLEINGENVPLLMTIKSEPTDSSSLGVNGENIPLPVTIKSEPEDSYETLCQPVSVKNEPGNTEISPNLPDIENMKTPIHNPKALSDSPHSPLLAVSTNVTLVDFVFPVQANLSYLPIESDSRQTDATVNVKKEPGKETDEEIEIIGEKKRKPKSSQRKIRVKTVEEEEIVKVKTEFKEKDELDILYEQRQEILRKLNQETERRTTSDMPRSYKRQLSRSPPRKYKRSASPRRRSIRSPSPRRYNRSPHRHRSPSDRRSRRSPSVKRSKRSPSPNERRRRRSPSSPTRFKKEPLSPVSDRRRERSRSPFTPIKVKKEPQSPVSDRRRERSRRSPSFVKRDVYDRTKSPTNSQRDRGNKRSRSRSPRRR